MSDRPGDLRYSMITGLVHETGRDMEASDEEWAEIVAQTRPGAEQNAFRERDESRLMATRLLAIVLRLNHAKEIGVPPRLDADDLVFVREAESQRMTWPSVGLWGEEI